MEGLLEPFDGHVSSTRNGTELSKLCEGLVATFVRNKAAAARVRCEACGYDAEAMYKCLWGITQKDDWKRTVRVHKQGEHVLLVRKG